MAKVCPQNLFPQPLLRRDRMTADPPFPTVINTKLSCRRTGSFIRSRSDWVSGIIEKTKMTVDDLGSDLSLLRLACEQVKKWDFIFGNY